MLENIRASFPGKSAAEIRAIAEASIVQVGRGIAIFSHLPDLASALEPQWAAPEGMDHLEAAHRRGKGVILFTAHYACWEITAAYLMRTLPRAGAVMRPLDNPKIESLIAELRTAGRGTFIPKNQVIRQGLPFLKQNGTLGILMDQNFAAGGVFVPFFGRLAATTPIVSILARRSGAAVLPMHGKWDGWKTRVIIGPEFTLSQNSDPQQAVAGDTAGMTSIIEGWIRDDPTQWLWLHNRWKRRPQQSDQVWRGTE